MDNTFTYERTQPQTYNVWKDNKCYGTVYKHDSGVWSGWAHRGGDEISLGSYTLRMQAAQRLYNYLSSV